VTLVGYTNAGKTSLMNALTNAGLSARDRPFETLDTTSRALTRHGGDVLLSDTVGFIRRLPERLMASFESTLAEVAEASLLLVVIDASDPEAATHLKTTLDMLERLNAAAVPRLVVFNKCDKVSDPTPFAELAGNDAYVAVAAHDPQIVDQLREEVLRRARQTQLEQDVFVPYAQSSIVKYIYAHCRVSRSEASNDGTRFTIHGAPHHIQSILRRIEECTA
jgi:GTP-binding protein HflX